MKEKISIIVASDSYKGSLTSEQIIDLVEKAAVRVFGEADVFGVPVADGGEGTVDAVVKAVKGQYRTVAVHGPLMEEVEASYGLFGEKNAVIEMAAASGLPLVPTSLRDPLNTTSYGTGELIRDAMDMGIRNISIAIGGSATNDGGMGAMKALGVKFYDSAGSELSGCGRDLSRVASIDMSGIHPGVKETEFTIMCDVNNPLTGPDGATYVFGPQKGGSGAVLDELEAGMISYASVVGKTLGEDRSQTPGSGAAGGLGFALMVFLKGQLKSGIETVLDLIGFDQLIKGRDLCITGEGRIDWQSAFGKVPSGVGQRCKSADVPCVVIAGGMGKGADNIYEHGISGITTTINGPMTLEEAMENAKELYLNAAERTLRLVWAGMKIADASAR